MDDSPRRKRGWKKNLEHSLGRDERQALIDWEQKELPISTQAKLLHLNRSSLYYQSVPPSPEEFAIKHRIDEIFTEVPYYGYRKMTAQINLEGWEISKNTVATYMQEMGLRAIHPGPNLSKRAHKAAIYPYLLRNIKASSPNHIWGIDITYIRLRGGWMYLVAVLDWYSRYVVSWQLDQTMHLEFVLEAFNKHYKRPSRRSSTVIKAAISRAPVILNCLKSMKYASVWTAKGEHSTIFSLSGCGEPLNIWIEHDLKMRRWELR